MTGLAAALRFLEAFPEATAFNVVLVRAHDKMPVVSRPQCSAAELHKNLPTWLSFHKVHFFIRPLMANVVMVDLDAFDGYSSISK